ncbi:nucleoside diphosphate kinase-like [Ylistrum balloti]|uniref:nucleoside diphosphate kinase-like n=1 Tax=Ylistrum balloti TaxID=509963 RepID=UPI002905D026|nr:nucleoside diphosphate kinase-like [Ylistrum balloti]
MSYELEFVMLKPGVLEKRIVGQIVQRFEQRGLELKAIRVCMLRPLQLESLYREHKDKVFYNSLVQYMGSSKVMLMVWGGLQAVAVTRALVGATDPLQATPGSIRGDFALGMPENIVHASDSVQSATREIKLFFKASEFL